MVKKIISGGQTGVDRAGLDLAIEIGIEHGGYAPKSYTAEDGKIPDQYNLQALTRGGYHARTKKNVQVSDGTVVFFEGALEGGSKRTIEHAKNFGKPFLSVNFQEITTTIAVQKLRRWIEDNNITILNVAGPRLSKSPTTYSLAKKVLKVLLKP